MFPLLLAAQQLNEHTLAAGGASKTQSSVSIDWTVGQTISATTSAGDHALSTGIHQPLKVTEVLNILGAMDPEIKIYPNPVVETLHVTSNETQDLILQLHDLEGREIISTSTTTELDLKNISNGIYLLTIQYQNYSSQHKIIKH